MQYLVWRSSKLKFQDKIHFKENVNYTSYYFHTNCHISSIPGLLIDFVQQLLNEPPPATTGSFEQGTTTIFLVIVYDCSMHKGKEAIRQLPRGRASPAAIIIIVFSTAKLHSLPCDEVYI